MHRVDVSAVNPCKRRGAEPSGGAPMTARLPDVEKSGPVNEAGERRVKPCSPLAMRRPGLGAASSHINLRHRWGHLSFTGNESANKSEVNMRDAEREECRLGALQACDSGKESQDRHSFLPRVKSEFGCG